MLNQPMMEKLLAMRLQGMVDGLKAQEQDRAANELSFLERLSLLVDQQWDWRENQALARRLKAAKLRGPVWQKTQPGFAITRTFSCWVQPAWARASSPWLWRRRLVVTATPRSICGPQLCCAISLWHVRMEACATYWHD